MRCGIRPVVAGLLLLSVGFVGCGGGPEAESGPDAYRHQAVEVPLGEAIVDELSWPGGDRTDWKRFSLRSGGLLSVSVHFTNVEAGARVELYDTYGKLVTKRLKEGGRDAELSFSVRVPAGRYFLRLRAADEGDRSEYTLVVNQGEAG